MADVTDPDRPTRPQPRRRRRGRDVAFVAAAVLAAVATACSARSSDSTAASGSFSGATNSSGSSSGGSSGGGWADCADPCSFSGGGSAGEAGSLDSYATAAEDSAAPTAAGGGATTTTVGGALPTTGPVEKVVGPVTAGSVDDNEDWDEYLRYRQEFDASGVPVEHITVEGRQVFTVTDGDGKPVLGATIEVRDAGGATVATLTTYADGRALFFPPTTVDPNSQSRPRYTATVSKGDVREQVALDPETREYPVRLDGAARPTAAALDVVFLVDTTGSMGDEIDRLKANISSMAEKIAELPAAPDVNFGMTLYRDQGDLFVTRTFDLTGDHAAFATALDEVQADGGGDTPEDLDAGLHDALTKQSWRGGDTVKLVFVVADAPPHLDYPGSVSYADSVRDSAARGIKILPIGASGLDAQGEYVMRQLAQITLGRFVFLTYGVDGAGPGDSTPMNVERDQYSVLPLDELVVQLVADELAPLAG